MMMEDMKHILYHQRMDFAEDSQYKFFDQYHRPYD